MVASEISKFLMVGINIIFMIFGLASFIVGLLFKFGWDEVRKAFADHDLQDAGDTLAYSAIVFGAFILVVSLGGCIGACCRVKCLLVVYAIVVILLLIAEVVCVCVIAGLGNYGKNKVAESLKVSLKNYNETSADDKSKAFSEIFTALKCCGVQNYTTDFTTDTAGVPFYTSKFRPAKYGNKIPITCCRDVDFKANLDADYFDKHAECLMTPNDKNAYTKGCLDEIYDEINNNKAVLIGVGVTIFVIEILVVIMAFILCCRGDDDAYIR